VSETQPPPAPAAEGLWATARRWLHAAGDERATQRLAATVFAIRILGAALAYISQVLFARWLGESDYGVYAYVWTWLITLGSILDLGMAVSAQKFIPLYRHDDAALLRGFLRGSRWLTFAAAVAAAAALACVTYVITPLIDPRFVAPFYLGCLALPAFVMANMQDGIARSHDWMTLAQIPQFVARHALTIGFAAGLIALGMKLSVTAAMTCSIIAIWLIMVAQMLLLQRRISSTVEAGPSAYAMRAWLSTAFPILLVEGFYLLLANTDIVVLQIYRTTAEVGVYFAVIKTFALVSFVHYALATTAAHRFSEFHASGDTERLARYVESVIKWTFWPSLVAIVVLLVAGRPLLSLFGPRFADGFVIMPVFAVGILARAAIGPVERLLNMLGEQRLCAAIYALAFSINLAGCLLTVPRYGGIGAAASTSLALVIESVLLFWVTRRRLGFHAFALAPAPGSLPR
jgi:O-antigen/teichoic acid export membrane protein